MKKTDLNDDLLDYQGFKDIYEMNWQYLNKMNWQWEYF